VKLSFYTAAIGLAAALSLTAPEKLNEDWDLEQKTAGSEEQR
jgi:hypothetical protein